MQEKCENKGGDNCGMVPHEGCPDAANIYNHSHDEYYPVGVCNKCGRDEFSLRSEKK